MVVQRGVPVLLAQRAADFHDLVVFVQGKAIVVWSVETLVSTEGGHGGNLEDMISSVGYPTQHLILNYKED